MQGVVAPAEYRQTAGNRDRRDPSEGRGASHGQNHWKETLEETMSSTNTSTKRQWIAEQAREHPERAFTTLHRFIDLEWMQEAYRLTRKDGAAGIDGVTAADYEKDLEANLLDLLGRIKSGSYFAPQVRRHYIPKADGTTRPLGIPTFEDKVAQRAIVMLMEPVYEADFLPCSHGFRPGRSAQDALPGTFFVLIETVSERLSSASMFCAGVEHGSESLPQTGRPAGPGGSAALAASADAARLTRLA